MAEITLRVNGAECALVNIVAAIEDARRLQVRLPPGPQILSTVLDRLAPSRRWCSGTVRSTV